ncbi:MAG: isoleucine--tRNA ligase [Fimbriimonadaceae bacterium]|nr:isoleucine--tRNA ligase [Fimbriimonadaceae bacterium]
MNYRDTVTLPQTDFAQRANLAQREPARLQQWAELDLYQRQLARREAAGAPVFELHDGPPYSNGHIHIGHVLNKVLKDIVTRYRDLAGYVARYRPGWDNHGLPIEYAVSQEFQKKGKPLETVPLRRACRAYAEKWVKVQREDFQRLGVRGDWEHPYLTMSHDFEAGIVEAFATLAKQGYVYRGERIVQWAPSLQTALADAEIEYAEKVSPSIYVAFAATTPGTALAGLEAPHLVIWTTTPWTIPANLAIAVHPDYDYRVIAAGGRHYLLADHLANSLVEAFGWADAVTVRVVKGAALLDVVTQHPLYDRPSPVVAARYVTLDEGTGCVHTAPGHGKDDFGTGRKHGLPAYCPVDERGCFTTAVGERLAGRKVLQANDEVCAMLSEAAALLRREEYRHQYPHDWRAHEPIIFRATTQWFLNIDHGRDGVTHRAQAVEAVKDVTWFPKEGHDRIRPMVENRPDWCLSRQRAWGVGIPAFYCQCGETILNPATLDAVVEVVRQQGSDAWFELPPEQLLPAGYTCPQCGAAGATFRKETDVLDVWFDSGSTHQVCYPPEQRPVDLYLEGSDQHRGWFNSSLMVSVGVDRQAPYRSVVTHGFVLDSAGKAMSKSLGNVVAPSTVIDQYGADVLRLWVASIDFCQDVRLGDEILKRVADSYRTLRNSFRFLLGNLHDFDPAADRVAFDALGGLDRYILHRLETLKAQAVAQYESYEFQKLVQGAQAFVQEVSAVYLDVAKDELYCGAPNGPGRRAIQTVLYDVCSELARILAPVLCFTCDEVWEHLPGVAGSVHLTDWPLAVPERLDAALASDFARLLELRDFVKLHQEQFNADKPKGEKTNPLEMAVALALPADDLAIATRWSAELRALLVVSQVSLAAGELACTVQPAAGHRCERCWRVWEPAEFGQMAGHEKVCNRCAAVVEQR